MKILDHTITMSSLTIIQSYKDLIVWQRAMSLASEIYEVTSEFPKNEQFGITAQMRSAAVSIPSNIAEGRQRGSKKEFRRFLLIAYASGAELETQLLITKNLSLNNINLAKAESLLSETMKMLNALIKTLSTKPSS